jgi:hypothetical protein
LREEVEMPAPEPPQLRKWTKQLAYVNSSSSSLEPDGKATLVEPVPVERDRSGSIATLTYKIQVICPDGKMHHDTVIIQRPHLPEPENATEAQIAEYNAVIWRSTPIDLTSTRRQRERV